MGALRPSSTDVLTAAFVAVLLALPAAAQQPIQKQETDWEGVQVELTEVKRDGDVLNVKFIIRNVGDKQSQVVIQYADAYVLDMANKKKYSPYHGPDKVVFAGPLHDKHYQGRFYATIDPRKRKIAWIKFVAPAPDVKKVSVIFPGVLPFEGVIIAE